MSATDLPADIVDYLAGRDTARTNAAADALMTLTPREFALVREAAVMGWVQGRRHHDLQMPADTLVAITVVDACRAFPDLYPTIAGLDAAGGAR